MDAYNTYATALLVIIGLGVTVSTLVKGRRIAR